MGVNSGTAQCATQTHLGVRQPAFEVVHVEPASQMLWPGLEWYLFCRSKEATTAPFLRKKPKPETKTTFSRNYNHFFSLETGGKRKLKPKTKTVVLVLAMGRVKGSFALSKQGKAMNCSLLCEQCRRSRKMCIKIRYVMIQKQPCMHAIQMRSYSLAHDLLAPPVVLQ